LKISVDPEWWKNIFDDIYLITDARSVCDPNITSREIDLICELLHLNPDDRILDLCGGHGRHSLELCTRGITKCTILDYSQFLIDYGRECAHRSGIHMKFVQADARKTGLPSGDFNHVLILGNSLGYCDEPDADLEMLSESHRLLCSGGHVLVDVVNGYSIRESFSPNAWHEIEGNVIVCRQREIEENRINAREIVLSKDKGLLRDQTYSIRFYEPQSLSDLLKTAGFIRVEVQSNFSPHQGEGDYGCMNHRMIAIGVKP
jgi:D-alanine-D-alanine ligase